MARVNNLFDLHKIRRAKISDDYKQLVVFYELQKPTGLKKNKIKKRMNSIILDCDIFIEYKYKEKKLFIKITHDKSNLNKLYQIFLVIAYLLGNEIELYFKYKNFPYYDIPHNFNFGNYHFCFSNNKRLILEPRKTIEKGYKLLQNNNSFFQKIAPFMLNINTISYSDVRFFAEFSLLEFLATKSKASGLIFQKKDDKKELKKLSKQVLDFILKQKFKILKNKMFEEKLKNVLIPTKLNEKGYAKDKITSFISKFDSSKIKSYGKYVKEWNHLRSSKGLAHGNVLKRDFQRMPKDQALEKKLHQLLSLIVYEEFSNFKI